MKSAVAYYRVSTEEQRKKGFSINTQAKVCEQFAKDNGYRIIKAYIEEGLSAKNLNRLKAREMLKYCNCSKNNVKAVIVWRLDRLSRNNPDYHGVIRPIFKNNDIRLLSATEVNLDTIEGEYVRNISMCNNEYELQVISKRTRDNMHTIAQSGRKPGKAPIGYLNIGEKDEPKRIIVDDKYAPYIKRIFELYATGLYSFKSLKDKIYLEGFRHPKTGKKFPTRKIEWILHNSFYVGEFIWGGEVYTGSHIPIVSKELFYKVQDMFKDMDRTKKHDVEFAYTGLIKCANCGCYYTAEFKRGKSKKGHYVYYRCSNSKEVHKKLKHYREDF